MMSLWRRLRASADLESHELVFAFVADLEEGLAGHVLDSRVRLMHEFKQLVHHRLQKLPVVLEEARILANNIPAESNAVDSSNCFSPSKLCKLPVNNACLSKLPRKMQFSREGISMTGFSWQASPGRLIFLSKHHTKIPVKSKGSITVRAYTDSTVIPLHCLLMQEDRATRNIHTLKLWKGSRRLT